MNRVAILGSTGSVGQNALAVISEMRDPLDVVGLAAHGNWKRLADQARAFRTRRVALVEQEHYRPLANDLGDEVDTVYTGDDGIAAMLSDTEPDIVVCAVAGAAGLPLTLAAINHCRRIALANKESLVMAGSLVLELARDHDVEILPVDSEHSAIYQAMAAGAPNEVEAVILTSSGGALGNLSREELAGVTVEQALDHPTWQMGRKITIASATLMNKALEIIEARWLFGLDPDQIKILMHPESILHGMVRFRDGSMVAQLAPPDMRVPIQYALTHPERLLSDVPRCNLAEVGKLTFSEPDHDRFPSLGLGYRAAKEGGTLGAVLNAANEVAVDRFLEGAIPFVKIDQLVKDVFDAHQVIKNPTLEEIYHADIEARREAEAWSG